jgi:hypothetical protein
MSVQIKAATGCWIWQRATNKLGYGITEDGLAHRLVWKVINGDIPEGMCVCHKCDNPQCVNPDHLFLGTHQDNMTDMVNKNRARPGKVKGESHGMTSLSSAQVEEIRMAEGVTQRELAIKYGVSQGTISNIRRGATWK